MPTTVATETIRFLEAEITRTGGEETADLTASETESATGTAGETPAGLQTGAGKTDGTRAGGRARAHAAPGAESTRRAHLPAPAHLARPTPSPSLGTSPSEPLRPPPRLPAQPPAGTLSAVVTGARPGAQPAVRRARRGSPRTGQRTHEGDRCPRSSSGRSCRCDCFEGKSVISVPLLSVAGRAQHTGCGSPAEVPRPFLDGDISAPARNYSGFPGRRRGDTWQRKQIPAPL